MAVLREYHTALGALVDKYEGTVERFTGDGLLVVFNDPLPCADPSLRAVHMAIEMRDEVAKLAQKWSRLWPRHRLWHRHRARLCHVRPIGYAGRLEYSVIGTVVNLAARLCAQASAGQILIDRKFTPPSRPKWTQSRPAN